jgi:phosphoribosylformylglycinamidine synthase
MAIKGIGEACEALGFPIVSGNVSLYNETTGRAIPPTPTIGGVGLLPDWGRMARIGFSGEGHTILLAGAPADWGTHLGQSLYARRFFGRDDGAPPPVDLAFEKTVGDFVRGLIREGALSAVHDCSDGGLAVALAEMAMAGGIGAVARDLDQSGNGLAALFFGEDQGRYVVTVAAPPDSDVVARLCDRATDAGIHMPVIGATGGGELKLGKARAIPLVDLKAAHESWFARFMGE